MTRSNDGFLKIIDTPLQGLKILERRPVDDSRGHFERLYCSSELESAIGQGKIVQINRSFTGLAGTIRGLHYQIPPHCETKIVTCIRGEVFDVAVDVRAGSPTFLRWYGIRLSSENQRSFVVPAGFAHGFQTLTQNSEMLYFHTAPYASGSEQALNAMDPMVSISWPLPNALRSDRDSSHSFIADSFLGIEI